ncbi:MAG: phytoene desaturase family protein [Ginsengibacter sp.]
MRKVIIIGSGFGGLSAASFMAKAGWDVTVIEKHEIPGGRARQLKASGFTFDMGPSWYWMPEVFEKYFACFGKKVSDYYSLQRLDPSYRIYWENKTINVPANYEKLKALFEKIEPGSGRYLEKFLKEAAYKYEVGMNKLVFKPARSFFEFLDWQLIKGFFKLDVIISFEKHVNKHFKNPRLRQLLEFPVLFLGALPRNTPALYSLMNYADIKSGTWYPAGGMYQIVDGMYKLAKETGVKFLFGRTINKINCKSNIAVSVTSVCAKNNDDLNEHVADVIIANADYHFVEKSLLPKSLRSYSDKYWDNRVMAPSCLLYYVGLNKKLSGLAHHSLFFDVNFEKHGEQIYTDPMWPDEPLFYVSATSVTDNNVAPEGCENLFFLIPVAADLPGDSDEIREIYFEKIVKRFEKHIGQTIKKSIIFKQSFGPDDFVNEYNAFKGNAYGLANTLLQTAVFKPACRSKKVKNLFYTGQLTVPGPGVPPSLVSGQVVATEVLKHFK